MDIRRLALFSALFFVGYTLWMTWQHDFPSTQKATSIPLLVQAPTITNLKEAAVSSPVTVHEVQERNTGSLVEVKTDVLNLSIDTLRGDIVQTTLTQYPVSVEDNTPFPLLMQDDHQNYVANSDLLVQEGQQVNPIDFSFKAEKNTYVLSPGQKELIVTLKGQTKEGLEVTKQFIFTEGSYLVKVGYSLKNEGQTVWQGFFNTALARTAPQSSSSIFGAATSYTGASYANPGVTNYKKVSFKEMSKSNLEVDVVGGWTAMQQHYFLTAWIPSEDFKNRIYTRVNDSNYLIGAVSQAFHLEPGASKSLGASLYLGPEEPTTLAAIAKGLDLTVDYGILWFISSLLMKFMSSIYQFIGNWGWTIVLVTVAIKLMFFRLSATSYKSMANMRKLQPKLLAIRERYAEDKAKASQATMELYRQEKVNPLGGCLPILIQLPVFFALYWVLVESVALRQAPFILWIHDLAAADPYHVLPILMAATMFIQQLLNPAPADPTQARVMMFLPVVFTVLMWNLPSGLVLYWVVNNTLSIAQQWYITQKYAGEKS